MKTRQTYIAPTNHGYPTGFTVILIALIVGYAVMGAIGTLRWMTAL